MQFLFKGFYIYIFNTNIPKWLILSYILDKRYLMILHLGNFALMTIFFFKPITLIRSNYHIVNRFFIVLFIKLFNLSKSHIQQSFLLSSLITNYYLVSLSLKNIKIIMHSHPQSTVKFYERIFTILNIFSLLWLYLPDVVNSTVYFSINDSHRIDKT